MAGVDRATLSRHRPAIGGCRQCHLLPQAPQTRAVRVHGGCSLCQLAGTLRRQLLGNVDRLQSNAGALRRTRTPSPATPTPRTLPPTSSKPGRQPAPRAWARRRARCWRAPSSAQAAPMTTPVPAKGGGLPWWRGRWQRSASGPRARRLRPRSLASRRPSWPRAGAPVLWATAEAAGALVGGQRPVPAAAVWHARWNQPARPGLRQATPGAPPLPRAGTPATGGRGLEACSPRPPGAAARPQQPRVPPAQPATTRGLKPPGRPSPSCLPQPQRRWHRRHAAGAAGHNRHTHTLAPLHQLLRGGGRWPASQAQPAQPGARRPRARVQLAAWWSKQAVRPRTKRRARPDWAPAGGRGARGT